MANFSSVVNHVIKFEGGHSSDPHDNALRYGHSGVYGKGYDNRYPNNFIHTNKGIIWNTYLTFCKRVNKTPNAQEFINMNMTLWKDIAYNLYWKPYGLDNVNSQAIAEIIFEGYWGGGGNQLVKSMQTKLNELGFKGKNGNALVIDGAMGVNSIYALNNATKKYSNETAIIRYMTSERLSYLQSLSDWSIYGKGWTNRVNEMLSKALETARGQQIASIFLIGGLFFLTYKAYKRYDKKVMWGGRI
jgi:lysozyme family protein